MHTAAGGMHAKAGGMHTEAGEMHAKAGGQRNMSVASVGNTEQPCRHKS